MKTAEEILITYDHSSELTGEEQILMAMKEYATEVAKEALKNAAISGKVLVEGELTKKSKVLFTLFDKCIDGVVRRKVSVDRQSILDEANIPTL